MTINEVVEGVLCTAMTTQDETTHKLAIAVLGAGKIGLGAGRLWLRAGHQVIFGVRRAGSAGAATAEFAAARETNVPEAAAAANIVLLAVPFSATAELVGDLGAELRGRIVIDATNPVGTSPEGHVISTLGADVTAGGRMSTLLPESAVVRAYTHVPFELLESRGATQSGRWGMAIAGDDEEAKGVVAELVTASGYIPVDLGGLDASAPLDPGGALFPHIFTPADMRARVEEARRVGQQRC
jgi:8-hydroxy-5-deazaflavin:NADPH oxidoreductase